MKCKDVIRLNELEKYVSDHKDTISLQDRYIAELEKKVSEQAQDINSLLIVINDGPVGSEILDGYGITLLTVEV